MLSFSNKIAIDFQNEKLMTLFSMSLVIIALFLQVFYTRFFLRIKHKHKIWAVIVFYFISVALIITGYHFKIFLLICIAATIVGISQMLGELTIIGFLKCFPPIVFAGYSSGSGVSGFIGATMYLMFRIFGISFTTTLLSLLLFYPIFGIAFSWVIQLKLEIESHPQSQSNLQLEANKNQFSILDDDNENPSNNLIAKSEMVVDSQAILEENESQINFQLTWPNLKFVISEAKSIFFSFAATYFLMYICLTAMASLIKSKYQAEYKDKKSPLMVTFLFEILQLMFHIGSMLSRSSLQFFRIRKLWIILALQFAIMLVCFAQTQFLVTTSTWLPLVSLLLVGFFGGLGFVNVYHCLLEHSGIDKRYCELAITINNMFSNCGIILSSLFGYFCLFRLIKI